MNVNMYIVSRHIHGVPYRYDEIIQGYDDTRAPGKENENLILSQGQADFAFAVGDFHGEVVNTEVP